MIPTELLNLCYARFQEALLVRKIYQAALKAVLYGEHTMIFYLFYYELDVLTRTLEAGVGPT